MAEKKEDFEKRILRIGGVKKKVKLSKPSVYRLMREAAFPKPLRIGTRAVGWFEHEIDAWLESRRVS